jgi:hypothetical protein
MLVQSICSLVPVKVHVYTETSLKHKMIPNRNIKQCPLCQENDFNCMDLAKGLHSSEISPGFQADERRR